MRLKLQNQIALALVLAVTLVECFVISFQATSAQVVTTTPSVRNIDLAAHIVSTTNTEMTNGEYDVRFTLYTSDRTQADAYPSNTDPRVWEETQKVYISNGVLKTQLGTVTPIPANINFSANIYYLGMRIGTDSEMVPRKRIAAVPLALDSLSVGGATLGTAAGNILQLGPGGKINIQNLPTGTSASTLVLGNDSRLTRTTSITKAGAYSYLTVSGSTITLNQINLTSDVTGILPVANGGTGLGTIGAAGSIVYSTGAAYAFNAAGTSGQILTSNGAGAPTWEDLGAVVVPANSLDFTEFKDAMTLDANLTISGGIGNNSINIDSNTFFVDTANNRVGLGTITPQYALDVNGAIAYNGQLISTVAIGTAPFVVTSNTMVSNLNADLLDGQHANAFQLAGTYDNYQYWTLQANGAAGANITSTGTVSFDGAGIVATSRSGNIITITGTEADTLATVTGRGATTTNQLALNYNSGAPFSVLSSVMVNNLNAQYLGGYSAAYFAPLTNISGTQNFLSKFTGANTIGNSLVYDNGTNVGIGTSSPGYVLDVNGSFRANTTAPVFGAFTLTVPASGTVALGTGGTNQVAYWSGTNTLTSENYLSITRGGTGIGTTPTSGQLLIGNSSNGYTLANLTAGVGIGVTNASGSITIFSTLGDSIDISSETNLGVGGTMLQLSGDTLSLKEGTLTNGYLCTYTDANGLVCNTAPGGVGVNYWQRNGTNISPATIGDFVGIGTTAPTGLLDIAGGVKIGATYAGMATTAPANGLLVQGRLGVGTTVPGATLDVNGNIRMANNQSLAGNSANGIGYLDLVKVDTNNNFIWGSGNMNQHFFLAGGTYGMYIANGGNVGIGVTATNANVKLTVAGAMKIGATYAGTSYSAPANGLLIEGNLGIGNTSPAQALDVTGSIRYSNQLISIITTGTAPFSIASTTLVTNLNSDLLDGQHGAYYLASSGVSGTTNYISKFTGTNSIGNSLIYDSGTNIGIGNTAPDNLLTIGDNINGYGILPGISIGAAATRYLTVGQSLNNNVVFSWVYDATAGNAHASISTFAGSNNLRIQEFGGNVGIGPSNPTDKLDIAGGVKIGSSYAGMSTTAPTNGLLVQGNVGIGTTSPTQALDVTGSIHYSNQLISTIVTGTAPFSIASTTLVSNLNADLLDGQHGAYYLASSGVSGTTNYISKFTGTNSIGNSLIYDDGTHLGIGLTNPTGLFQVGIGATTPFFISTGGNVGIGTTNPLTKLTVLDTLSSSPRGILSMQISNDTSGARLGFAKARGTEAAPTTVATGDMLGRLMFRGYDGTNYLEMGSIEVGVSGTVAATRIPTYLSFSTATDASPSVLTERLRILNNGFVGIGTTNPLSLFSVGATSQFQIGATGIVTAGTWNGSTITVPYGGTGATSLAANYVLKGAGTGPITTSLIYDTGARIGIGTTNPTGLFQVGIGATTPFFISTGGNVGIGTTSPLALFSVGTSSAFQINNSGLIGLGGAVPLFSLGVDSTDSNKFKIYSGSSIAGTSEFTIDTNGVTSISNLEMGAVNFETNAGIIGWIDMPVTNGAIDNTVESYTAMLDGNPMLTIYGLSNGAGGVDNLGVGIGTTSPAQALDVTGSIRYSNQLISTIVTGTAPFSIASTTLVSNLNADLLDGQHGAYYLASSGVSGTTNYISKFTGANSIGNSQLFDTGTNIGIGNTNPDNLLTIGTNINGYGILPGISIGASAARFLTIGQGSNNNVVFEWNYNATAGNAYASLGTFAGSNNLRLQEFGGNVGIGPSNPTDKLDIAGGIKIGATYAGMSTTAPANGLLIQGNVGIGTTNPLALLDVNGDSYFGKSGQPNTMYLRTVTGAAPFSITTGGDYFDGVFDDVMYYGYNVGSGSAKLVTAEPQLQFNIESNYYVLADSRTYMEWSMNYAPPAAAVGVTGHRFIDFQTNRNDPVEHTTIAFAISGDGLFDIRNFSGNHMLRAFANGNVALGGSYAPEGQLQIEKGYVGASATYHGDMIIESGEVNNASNGLEFKAGTAGSGYGFRLATVSGTSGGIDFQLQSRQSSAAWSTPFNFTAGGKLGIGTTGPAAMLHAIGTSEQLRLGYNTTNYASFSTDSSGNLTIGTIGTNPGINLTPSGTGATTITGKANISDTLSLTGATAAASYIWRNATADGNILMTSTSSTFDYNIMGIGVRTVGDYNYLHFGATDDPSNLVSGMTLASNYYGGTLGIGTTNVPFYDTERLKLVSLVAPIMIAETYSDTANVGVIINQRRARGTEASPAAVQLGDLLGSNRMGGYNGASWSGAAVQINSYAAQTWTDNTHTGSELGFFTTPNNSGTALQRMRITNGGYVGIGTTAPTNLLDVAGGIKIGATYAGMATTAPANGMLVQGNVGIGTTNPTGIFQVGIGATTPFFISAAGNVGIGTTNPNSSFALHDAGNLLVDNLAAGVNAYSLIGQTPTAGGTPVVTDGLVVGRVLTFGSARGVVATAQFSGVASGTETEQGVNGFAVADLNSSGTMTATTNGGALRNRYAVNNLGSAAVSQASAVSAVIAENTNPGSASITNAADFHAETPNIATGNSVTNMYGLWVRGGSVSGTLTNRYGVYIDDLVGGTNRFGMYQAGATDLNYFAGNVGIGLTNPADKLDIAGGIKIGATYAGLSVTAPVNGMLVQGNVGIGTTNPGSYTLSVAGNMNVTGQADLGTGAVAVVINASGNLGIGTTNPDQALDVIGTIQSSSLLGGALNITTDANGNIIRDPSDARLKENIQTINGALDKVMALRGVIYNWKDKAKMGSQKDYGLIAQEVFDVVPELTATGADGIMGVKYTNAVGLLINAIQEQQGQIGQQSTMNSEQAVALTDIDLKTTQNITTVAQLQKSVDEQLSLASNNLLALNTNLTQNADRITALENMTTTLQSQIDELKKMTNQDLNVAQIEANTTDIEYIKTLLGIGDSGNVGDVTLLGKLEAEGVVAGAMTVKVSDREKGTIGTTTIYKVGETDPTQGDGQSVEVKTKAITATSKIFVTPKGDTPVNWIISQTESGTGFKIKLDKPVDKDTNFDWWVVEEK